MSYFFLPEHAPLPYPMAQGYSIFEGQELSTGYQIGHGSVFGTTFRHEPGRESPIPGWLPYRQVWSAVFTGRDPSVFFNWTSPEVDSGEEALSLLLHYLEGAHKARGPFHAIRVSNTPASY